MAGCGAFYKRATTIAPQKSSFRESGGEMKIFLKKIEKFISAAVFVAVLLVIVPNFNNIFPDLNRTDLVSAESKAEMPIDIPSNLNFLNDDKKAFIDYCKSIYGGTLPLTVNSDLFTYYGTVDGYRLYRLQSNLIPYEHAHSSETINGYTFLSDYIYRPSKTGLYVIGDKGVFTIDEVYKDGIVNIADIYDLYAKKNLAAYPGLSSASPKDLTLQDGKQAN
jgi:prepilin peptidase dependent protein B